MMPDYPLGETLDFKFTTRSFSTGAPSSLESPYEIQVYEDNNISQITAGETLTVDFDGVTGLNNLRIVATSGNGYESGKSYAAVISTGTVGSVSVVGEVVAQFSIERSSALRPTTAGRTLDVTATGEAGIDLDNTSGALGTVQFDADFLTAALIADNAFVAANFAASSLNGKGDWNINKTGYSISGSITTLDGLNDPTAAAIADAVWDEDIVAAHGTTDTAGLIISQLTSRAVTFNTAVDDTSILGQMADDGTATFDRTTDSLQAIADSGGSGPSADTIADAVWNELLDSAHQTAGSASVILQDILADTGTDGVAIASGAITAGTIAASALDGKGDWNINKTGYSLTPTTGLGNQTANITGTLSGSVGSVAGNVDGDVTGSVGSNLELGPTEVNTQVDTALSDIFLDQLLANSYNSATPPGAADSLLNEMTENDGGLTRFTTNALELAPTGGSAPTVAQIADGVWDEVLDSAHSVADSAGQKVKDILTDTANMNGSDGVTLATSQPNYAPAVAGNAMSLVANSVTSTSIQDNAITANKIATDAITNTKIAANAIGSSELATDAITSAQLANSAVDEIWQTTLTESYAADGAEGTATQILYAMQQFMLDADYSGTALTVRRLNGTSQAYVITVDDATTPTDKNRTA